MVEYIGRGSEAMNRIQAALPTIIILESDHPTEMPISKILEDLKSNSITQTIPVILFSWLDENDLAIEKGADIYIQKPVMYADFQVALQRAGLGQG